MPYSIQTTSVRGAASHTPVMPKSNAIATEIGTISINPRISEMAWAGAGRLDEVKYRLMTMLKQQKGIIVK